MRTLRTISIIVACVGLSVIAGWIYDIDYLKRILPGAVTQKFSTALCVVSGSVMLLCMSFKAEAMRTLSVGFTFLLSSVVGLMLIEEATGIRTNIESLIVSESEASATFSAEPGEPSRATMIAFALVALYGGCHIFNGDHRVAKTWMMALLGVVVFAIGGFALIGYVLVGLARWSGEFAPPYWMTYYSEARSSAMAVHTAGMLSLIGGVMARMRPYGKAISCSVPSQQIPSAAASR